MSEWIDFSALWKVIIVGLLVGAGLPAVFAFGMRALTVPRKRQPIAAAPGDHVGTNPDDHVVAGGALGIAVAVTCFGLVLAVTGMGIYIIVAG